MVGRGAAARVDGEPARERERNLVVAQRGGGDLHRIEELLELLVAGHGPVRYPRMRLPILG